MPPVNPKFLKPGKIVCVQECTTDKAGEHLSGTTQGIILAANLNLRLKNPKRIAEQSIEVLLDGKQDSMVIEFVPLSRIVNVSVDLVLWHHDTILWEDPQI